jgi:hypothetical protein
MPRLRVSPVCLLPAKSAAICKRTWLSLAWPSSHRRRRLRRCWSGRIWEVSRRRVPDPADTAQIRPFRNSESSSARRPSSHGSISRACLLRCDSADVELATRRYDRRLPLRLAKEQRHAAHVPSVPQIVRGASGASARLAAASRSRLRKSPSTWPVGQLPTETALAGGSEYTDEIREHVSGERFVTEQVGRAVPDGDDIQLGRHSWRHDGDDASHLRRAGRVRERGNADHGAYDGARQPQRPEAA